MCQEAPWTADEVLRQYRFCNVYRELDCGTLAISKYLVQKGIPPEMKLFNIIAYRFFNRRDTIEVLFGGLLNPQKFDFKYYEQRFDEAKAQGSIFSNAYLITAHAVNQNYRPHDKHVQILLMLDALKGRLTEMISCLREKEPQQGLNVIEKYVRLAGKFLSGQILLDATYAGDIVDYCGNDFLVVGPGAHWGLNILSGRKLSMKEADEKCRYLYSIQEKEFARLLENTGKDWQAVRWNNPNYCGGKYLCLHDIQNSLCEFRKYWRLKSGENAKKRYYKG